MRGATLQSRSFSPAVLISIHAPHAGSDLKKAFKSEYARYFNPRSPCGERLGYDEIKAITKRFQSTLPMRGATTALDLTMMQTDFNPRSPCGERRPQYQAPDMSGLFQSTLPMRGATVKQKTLNPCGIQHIILRTS